MTKKTVMAAALAAGISATAMASETETAATTGPIDAVNALFDAMRAADGAAVRALVAEGAQLSRALPDGSRQASTFERWASWIDTLKPGDADEQIYGVTATVNDRMAAVVAPFTIYINGKLAACGRNHFTLMQENGKWVIVHGMDEPYQGDCAAFRASIEG